ncbi:MAG: type I-E CRISPR-associated endonuclease Cas1 [Bdellovibrionales bacterium]|nr:type I-E CRISPR-associated endonuclease Cas1 [Bdellovibrionales bacterium]
MIKERRSMIFVEKGQIDIKDNAFVVIDSRGVRTHIPIGGLACLMLEPGTRISHAAVGLAARVGCLLLWVGEGAVRVYSSGQPGGARSDRLLYQAKLALDENLRLKVVRKMYEMRFKEPAPARRSIEQLRALESARVKASYKLFAQQFGVIWRGRKYDPRQWGVADRANRCLSCATSCLYGIAEAAVLAAGYSPAIGFLHTGKSLSFVYDIADIVKFETVIPIAFEIAANEKLTQCEREVRYRVRDVFRESRLLKRIIPLIEEVLAAGEIKLSEPHPEAQPIAIEEKKGIGDVGHRH